MIRMTNKVQSTLRHSKATLFYKKQRKGSTCFGKMKIGRSSKNNIRNLPRKSTLTILSPLHFNPWKFFTITTSAILDSSIRNVNNNSVKVVCNKRTRKQTRYTSCSDLSLRFSFISSYTKVKINVIRQERASDNRNRNDKSTIHPCLSRDRRILSVNKCFSHRCHD